MKLTGHITKRQVIVGMAALLIVQPLGVALALPGAARNRLAHFLLRNGTRGAAYVRMDWPTAPTGKVSLEARDRPVAPPPQAYMRRNPIDARPVGNGMRKEARQTTGYGKSNSQRPKGLPAWSDRSGLPIDGDELLHSTTATAGLGAFVLRGVKVAGVATLVSGSVNGYRYVKGDMPGEEALLNIATSDASATSAWLATEGVMSVVGERVILAVETGTGVGVAYFVLQGTRDVLNALRGELNPNDLPGEMVDNGLKALSAGVATGVIIGTCSNPGTAVIVLTSLGTVIAVDYAYSRIKPLFENERRVKVAYYSRLPQSMKQVSPLEWASESYPLEKLGRTYGPRLGSPVACGSVAITGKPSRGFERARAFGSRL